jgi:hypothetical protein
MTAPKWLNRLTELQTEFDSVVGKTFHSTWEDFLFTKITAAENEAKRDRSRREHTWDWFTSHYGKLEDWARKQLPEPFKTEFFNCVANGTWNATLDVAPPYICNAGFVIRPSGYFRLKTAEQQLLFNQWERAEDAEEKIKELQEKIKVLKGQE